MPFIYLHYNIAPHILEAHAKTIQNYTIKFPVKHVEMKYFPKGASRSDLSEQNIVSGPLPTKIIIGLVNSEAFKGKITKNPFNFEPFGATSVVLRQNGLPIPYEELSLDYTHNRYQDGYFSLLQACGSIFSNNSPGISYENYKNGYTLYGFDLGVSKEDVCHDLIREGKISLNIKLSAASTHGITIVVYLEYNNVIEIDKEGHVHKNSD